MSPENFVWMQWLWRRSSWQTIQELRKYKEFTDVTMACEDGPKIAVHGCFLNNLLKSNRHQLANITSSAYICWEFAKEVPPLSKIQYSHQDGILAGGNLLSTLRHHPSEACRTIKFWQSPATCATLLFLCHYTALLGIELKYMEYGLL